MVYIPRKSYPLAWTLPQIRKDLIEGGMDQGMAANIADTLNKVMQKQAVDERLNYQAIEGITGGKPYATIVVAASNSVAPGAVDADFVCTGTDDQITINAAIAAAGDRGHVLLLEGLYDITDSIDVAGNNDLWISGQGMGTHIRSDGTHAAIDLSGTTHSIRMSDLYLDAVTARTGTGMSVSESDSWVWNCHVEGFNVGIGAGGAGVQGVHIVNNNISDCEYGISISTLNWSIISHNFIHCDRGIQSNASWSIIANNTIRSRATDNVGITINGGTHSRYCDNVITDGYQGIFGQLLGACYHVVSGNKVQGAQREGIKFHDSSDMMIHNNSVIGCGLATHNTYSGIAIVLCDRFSVQGNMVRYVGATQTQYGIFVVSGNDNFVTNNDLKNSGATASFNDTATATIIAAGNRL